MEGVQINYTDLSDLFWEYKRKIENSVELLLENLQSCLSKIGLSQGAIESYETGSFITGKDAGALNTGIKIFGDLHEKNKEAYDEIYETEQKIKDDQKCLCICGIRNDSNRAGIYSGKSDIQKHSNNSRQRRHLNGSLAKILYFRRIYFWKSSRSDYRFGS